MHHIPNVGHLTADAPCVGFPVPLGHSLLALKSCLGMCCWGYTQVPQLWQKVKAKIAWFCILKSLHGNLEEEGNRSVSNSVRGVHSVLSDLMRYVDVKLKK